MKQHIAITDLTRMQEPKVCIAGYIRDGRCIRPVIPFQGIGEWFLRKDDCLIIRPFAVVELDFLRHVPQAPHTEDWEIDRFHRRLVTPQLPEEKKLKLLEKTASDGVAAIFGAEIHDDFGFYVRTGEGERSLGTIRPAEILELIYSSRADGNYSATPSGRQSGGPLGSFPPKKARDCHPSRAVGSVVTVDGKWDYRIVFKDQAGQTYRLAITDLAYRYYLDYGRVQLNYPLDDLTSRLARFFNQHTTFLRIGLARLWEKYPDRCYLQVTGIHTFPDYLRGRSFTDFVVPPASEMLS